MLPLTLIVPLNLYISPNKAESKLDLPDPTVPITAINSPFFISKFKLFGFRWKILKKKNNIIKNIGKR